MQMSANDIASVINTKCQTFYARDVYHYRPMIPGKNYVGLGVGAVIVRDNKVLMLLRSDACRNNRGLWTIPGGMVETSEGLEDAVRREVKEETGLHVTHAGFLCVSDRFFDDEHWVSILYRCGTEGEPSNVEPEKHLNGSNGRTWMTCHPILHRPAVMPLTLLKFTESA